MKVSVWVLSTTIPEAGAGPCMPFVFGSEAQAEAQAEASLRDEWNAAGITDEEADAPLVRNAKIRGGRTSRLPVLVRFSDAGIAGQATR